MHFSLTKRKGLSPTTTFISADLEGIFIYLIYINILGEDLLCMEPRFCHGEKKCICDFMSRNSDVFPHKRVHIAQIWTVSRSYECTAHDSYP